jgi:predicted amidohydrolase
VFRLAMAQMGSRIGDADRNLRRMLEMADDCRGSDLVCFPEASLTGYSLDPERASPLGAGDPRIMEMRSRARETGCAMAFGFVRRAGASARVSHAVAGADGSLLIYDKTHLGASESAYERGDSLLVAPAGGARAGIALCIESHVPEVSSMLRGMSADLILYPHASPIEAARRVDLWKRYVPARAYDNGVFAAACNSAPGGGILVADPKGRVVMEHSGPGDFSAVVDLDLPARGAPGRGGGRMADADFFSLRRPEMYWPLCADPPSGALDR